MGRFHHVGFYLNTWEEVLRAAGGNPCGAATPVAPQQAVIGDVGPLTTANIVEAMLLCLAGGS